MRINKRIASSGLCSRRKADTLITDGRVIVNGVLLKEPGYEVSDADIVTVDGIPLPAEEKKTYILLNKPVGYITSVSDERGRATVMELVADVPSRVFPVGRLDYNTSGLLILTSDGDFAYAVSHPGKKIGKTYRARISGFLTRQAKYLLEHGVDIGGFTTSPARVEVIRELSKQSIVEITIHEGKYHQVRKMFQAVGNPVQELTRIAIGPVRLGHLARGHWRKMTGREIAALQTADSADRKRTSSKKK